MRAAVYPSLEGRTVLVTGGASGIGAEIVRQFAWQHAKVAFVDIDADAGTALARELAADARHAPLFLPCDLRDIDALHAAVAQVQAALGAVTVLVNNAADDSRHTVEETTAASWDAGMAVNLRHQFFAAQAVAPAMRAAGGGSIVNLGSISWMLKQGGMPVYTTAKAAVQGLTRTLAREFGGGGIRVNTLVPGWVMTERQLRLWVSAEGRERIAQSQCIPRNVLPQDIARAALFLAADDSAMITAQDLVVDGGWA